MVLIMWKIHSNRLFYLLLILMKKIILISLLLFGIVLTGCNYQKSMSVDQIFEKKKECLNITEQIKQQMNDTYSSLQHNLDEIFYSPQKNSCIYVVESLVNWWTERWTDAVDYFDSKWNMNKPNTCSKFLTIAYSSSASERSELYQWCIKQQKQFDIKLKELKWE